MLIGPWAAMGGLGKSTIPLAKNYFKKSHFRLRPPSGTGSPAARLEAQALPGTHPFPPRNLSAAAAINMRFMAPRLTAPRGACRPAPSHRQFPASIPCSSAPYISASEAVSGGGRGSGELACQHYRECAHTWLGRDSAWARLSGHSRNFAPLQSRHWQQGEAGEWEQELLSLWRQGLSRPREYRDAQVQSCGLAAAAGAQALVPPTQ